MKARQEGKGMKKQNKEGVFYALKTAANAGFITVGVADPFGEPDQAGLKSTANIYIKNLNEFFKAWEMLV